MNDPVPAGARTELTRLVGRWHQLPADQALVYSPMVRDLIQRYADATAGAQGLRPQQVPDLGPAVLMDQLTVVVYDMCQWGTSSPHQVTADLTALRRQVR